MPFGLEFKSPISRSASSGGLGGLLRCCVRFAAILHPGPTKSKPLRPLHTSRPQLAAVKAALGPQVFAQLLQAQTEKDLAYLSRTAPKALGAANFAALSAPTPALAKALGTLATVGPGVRRAAADSPKQWQKYFLIGVAGEVVFIPLILLMAGFWDPRKAKRAEEEHEALIATELAALERSRVNA